MSEALLRRAGKAVATAAAIAAVARRFLGLVFMVSCSGSGEGKA